MEKIDINISKDANHQGMSDLLNRYNNTFWGEETEVKRGKARKSEEKRGKRVLHIWATSSLIRAHPVERIEFGNEPTLLARSCFQVRGSLSLKQKTNPWDSL